MARNILFAGDVDAIKEFVFETSFLPQIRGGSQILIDCEKEIKEYIPKILNGEIIYCEGGSFLIKIPSDKKEKAENYIKNIYLSNTCTATITLASENEAFQTERICLSNPEDLDHFASRIFKATIKRDEKAESYGLRVSFLSSEIKKRKQMKETAPFFEALPFGGRCQCCRKRMATERITRAVEPPEILRSCCVCKKKHDRGRSGEEGNRGKFNKDFKDFLEKQDIFMKSKKQPRDLDDLVNTAKRKYLAFIYADGNNISDLLRQANTEEDYKAISEGLYKGTTDSLFNALYSVCRPALKRDKYWPFEIINVGGDDITLLIQAGYAWEVALHFLENFSTNVSDSIRDKLGILPDNWQITASCGISIAPENYPVRFLQRLAEGSLSRAKRKAKEDRNQLSNAIDFIWLPNPIISENIESLVSFYHRNDRSLIARPYTLDDAIILQDIARDALIQIPSTQRHLWGEALERGMNASKNAIFYNIARESDEKKRKSQELILSRSMELIDPGNRQSQDTLWCLKKEGDKLYYCTTLFDVLELAELFSMREYREEEESTP